MFVKVQQRKRFTLDHVCLAVKVATFLTMPYDDASEAVHKQVGGLESSSDPPGLI